MAYVKKTWKDRITEHPNRRTLTNTSTNQAQTVDVVRAEGNVSVEGDALNAENLNGLEDRVAAGFAGVDSTLSPILQTVTEIKKVTSIPSDAASHPTTLYVITE